MTSDRLTVLALAAVSAATSTTGRAQRPRDPLAFVRYAQDVWGG